jgi:hypothetical protein
MFRDHQSVVARPAVRQRLMNCRINQVHRHFSKLLPNGLDHDRKFVEGFIVGQEDTELSFWHSCSLGFDGLLEFPFKKFKE